MNHILIATSNPGKLRDFAGAAAPFGIEIASIPNFTALPAVVEDGLTFEDNARKKAESYSRAVPGDIVLADDSGLEVDALKGAPGVHSARYAADAPHLMGNNTDDEANNTRLLRELKGVSPDKRSARFVCVIAAARDGHTLRMFRGEAEGKILNQRSWDKWIRLRSPVLFPADSEGLRRTESGGKSSTQSPRRRLPPVSGLVHNHAERYGSLTIFQRGSSLCER